MTIVAIHQPNFFPWLGFFDKMATADTLILMDNVQLPRTGKGSWVNRVRLMLHGEPKWATMPIQRDHGELPRIADVTIDNSQPWREKLIRSIQLSYAKAPHFRAVFPVVTSLLENRTDQLVEFNTHAIRSIAELLRIDTVLLSGSEIGGVGQATDLLVSMVQRVGADAYLCGAGAAAYQDDDELRAAGIEVLRQEFDHPVYPQGTGKPFVPGLSAIDALMHWGPSEVRTFLAGRGAPTSAGPA